MVCIMLAYYTISCAKFSKMFYLKPSMGARKLCKINVKTNRGNTIFYNASLTFLNFNIT